MVMAPLPLLCVPPAPFVRPPLFLAASLRCSANLHTGQVGLA
jgi:hypothetical protein